jgi:hypothetical protein
MASMKLKRHKEITDRSAVDWKVHVGVIQVDVVGYEIRLAGLHQLHRNVQRNRDNHLAGRETKKEKRKKVSTEDCETHLACLRRLNRDHK